MNIYVGNLSYDTDESALRAAFAEHGEVASCSLISDKYSGQSKGFAFVEMNNDDEAKKAMSALDGQDLSGRQIKVNEARPREQRSGGGGGGGRDRW